MSDDDKKVIGMTMFALSLIFMVGVGWAGKGHYWWAAMGCSAGTLIFAYLARKEME